MRHRCAILDDYQNVALSLADWTGVKQDADITVFTEPLGAKLAEALRDFCAEIRTVAADYADVMLRADAS